MIAVLIAAHNEEVSIRGTLLSVLGQKLKADRIVVAADNCTDRTAEIAASVPGVTVFETRDNAAKKPGALNQAWHQYCSDADLVVCIDADTVLDPMALSDWAQEFRWNQRLGGCSAKFTMLVTDEMTRRERLLVRLQRAEFAKWTDLAMKRGRRTSVLAGTACCIRNQALREIVVDRQNTTDGPGPWTQTSLVEDFDLTYRMRANGWETKVSATVRAYTDAMTDLRSLWAQRMKWQTGTVADLMQFGVNRLTLFDWWQQVQGLVSLAVRAVWLALLVGSIALGTFSPNPVWLIPPLIFLANDVRQSFRIPRRQSADVLVAALLLPQEMFSFMRAAWFIAAWSQALDNKVFGIPLGDKWKAQARAEVNRRPLDLAA